MCNQNDEQRDLGDATEEDIKNAHQQDLAIQDEYGVQFLTFWFNSADGQGFCLVDSPTKEAAVAVHKASHGLVPHDMVEVQTLTSTRGIKKRCGEEQQTIFSWVHHGKPPHASLSTIKHLQKNHKRLKGDVLRGLILVDILLGRQSYIHSPNSHPPLYSIMHSSITQLLYKIINSSFFSQRM